MQLKVKFQAFFAQFGQNISIYVKIDFFWASVFLTGVQKIDLSSAIV